MRKSLIEKGPVVSAKGLTKVVADGEQRLHWFTQVGHGVLPYDYYLDRYHRLVVVITGPRSYILDDNAEETVDTYRKGRVKQYRIKLAKMKGGERS